MRYRKVIRKSVRRRADGFDMDLSINAAVTGNVNEQAPRVTRVFANQRTDRRRRPAQGRDPNPS